MNTNSRIAVSLASLVLVAGTATADFSYSDFSSVAGLTFVGTAAQNVGTSSVYLTPQPATQNQSGAVWVSQRQDIGLGFEATMTVRVPFRNGVGADGMAFVIQNERVNAIGGYAGGMGYANNPRDGATTGILNSIAIELDTWSNQVFSDNSGAHVSIQSNGRFANSPVTSFSLANAAMPFDLNDGATYSMRVSYTPGTLSVFFNGSLTPTVSTSVNLASLLELETVGGTSPGRAWIGVTGSNGDAPNSATYELRSFNFTSVVVPAPGSAALLAMGGLLAARRRR